MIRLIGISGMLLGALAATGQRMDLAFPTARWFFEALVLQTKDFVQLEQDAPYADITIRARPALMAETS